MRTLSSRYIAGAELEDALDVVGELNAGGKLATVDVLGEEVRDASEAATIAAEYIAALDAFERVGLDANVSVKPTALGLKLGYDLCKRNVEAVIAAAEPTDRFVRVDMEDSSTTDDTLRLCRELRAEGHRRVGPVLQALSTANGRRRGGALRRERPALQGHLRRACVDPVPARRRGEGQLRRGAGTPPRRRLLRRRSRPTTSGSCRSRSASSGNAASHPTSTSSSSCSACARSSATGSSRTAIGSGSTSRTAASGTSTRSGGCRRTRRSPATSPGTSAARSFAR